MAQHTVVSTKERQMIASVQEAARDPQGLTPGSKDSMETWETLNMLKSGKKAA